MNDFECCFCSVQQSIFVLYSCLHGCRNRNAQEARVPTYQVFVCTTKCEASTVRMYFVER